jgi:hypothetical protein
MRCVAEAVKKTALLLWRTNWRHNTRHWQLQQLLLQDNSLNWQALELLHQSIKLPCQTRLLSNPG